MFPFFCVIGGGDFFGGRDGCVCLVDRLTVLYKCEDCQYVLTVHHILVKCSAIFQVRKDNAFSLVEETSRNNLRNKLKNKTKI